MYLSLPHIFSYTRFSKSCKRSPAVPYFYTANSDYWYNIFKRKKKVDIIKTETEEEENVSIFSPPDSAWQSEFESDTQHNLDQ